MNNGFPRMILGGVSLGFGLIFGAIASAEPLSTQESPAADTRLDELNFFAHAWQCESEMPVPGRKTPYQWSVLRDLNDFWFVGQAMTSEPNIFERETLGYNTVIGKFGRTIIGNDGKFANFLSDGWIQNTLQWKGQVVNMAAKTTQKHWIIITKTSDSQFKELEYVLSPTDSSRWLIASEKSCKR